MTAPYQIRAIDEWPGPLTKYRIHGQFKMHLDKMHRALKYELDRLQAKTVVLEIAVGPLDFKVDGSLRVHARPSHPGVVLAFGSKEGPLRFSCDQYHDWVDNLRAITLTLEALRAIDRWGATHDAEQYKGWAALPAGGAMQTDLAKFIEENGGSFEAVVKRLHPDNPVTGDQAKFQWFMERRKALAGSTLAT